MRLCRQHPINRMFNKTSAVPDATPTSRSVSKLPPIGVVLVVTGPPIDEAGRVVAVGAAVCGCGDACGAYGVNAV